MSIGKRWDGWVPQVGDYVEAEDLMESVIGEVDAVCADVRAVVQPGPTAVRVRVVEVLADNGRFGRQAGTLAPFWGPVARFRPAWRKGVVPNVGDLVEVKYDGTSGGGKRRFVGTVVPDLPVKDRYKINLTEPARMPFGAWPAGAEVYFFADDRPMRVLKRAEPQREPQPAKVYPSIREFLDRRIGEDWHRHSADGEFRMALRTIQRVARLYVQQPGRPPVITLLVLADAWRTHPDFNPEWRLDPTAFPE